MSLTGATGKGSTGGSELHHVRERRKQFLARDCIAGLADFDDFNALRWAMGLANWLVTGDITPNNPNDIIHLLSS